MGPTCVLQSMRSFQQQVRPFSVSFSGVFQVFFFFILLIRSGTSDWSSGIPILCTSFHLIYTTLWIWDQIVWKLDCSNIKIQPWGLLDQIHHSITHWGMWVISSQLVGRPAYFWTNLWSNHRSGFTAPFIWGLWCVAIICLCWKLSLFVLFYLLVASIFNGVHYQSHWKFCSCNISIRYNTHPPKMHIPNPAPLSQSLCKMFTKRL